MPVLNAAQNVRKVLLFIISVAMVVVGLLMIAFKLLDPTPMPRGMLLFVGVGATLSFLGLGAQPPTPEWGAMLNAGREYVRYAPWTMIFPGLALFLTVMAVNLVGDRLSLVLDPRQRGHG